MSEKIDLAKLREVAENAFKDWHSDVPTMPLRIYHGAFKPDLALTLIERVDAAEAKLDAVRAENKSLDRQLEIRADDSIAARIARQNIRAVNEYAAIVTERDELRATVELIRAAVNRHPKCDQHEDGDSISCGWKRAFADVVRTLNGQEGDK